MAVSKYQEVTAMAGGILPHWGEPLDDKEQALLKGLGFTANLPVYAAKIGFTKDDIRDALFEATYESPRCLMFSVEASDHLMTDQWPLYMMVLAASALWEPLIIGVTEVPTGRWPYANWHLEGFLFSSPLDGPNKPIPMRAYIDGIEQREDVRKICVQVARFPADVPLDHPLRWGVGAPGQAIGGE